MKWTLFARLDRTVAHARHLDVAADAPVLAASLVANNPRLLAGCEDAAETMARCALAMLCRLPEDIDEAAASLIDENPLAPAETLARVAALAYVALCDDLLPDDLPGGSGLIDDAISLRATGVGAVHGWDQDARARQLATLGVEARFLSLFLPRARLAEFDHALGGLFWTISTYTRAPLSEVKQVTRRLIERPPRTLAELLPEHDGFDTAPRPRLFALCDATLEPTDAALRFRYTDGVVIALEANHLRLCD